MRTKTQGELEAAVSEVVTRLHKEWVGKGPQTVSVAIRGQTVFIHVRGVLTIAESQLVAHAPTREQGASLVRDLRHHLFQAARSNLIEALSQTLGETPSSAMHDVAPDSDEAMLVFGIPGKVKMFRLRA